MKYLLYKVNTNFFKTALNKGLDTTAAKVVLAFHEALDLVESAYLEGRFSYLEWVTTRQEFLTTRLTLIEAASQVHLSKTEIETLTGLALKTEHNDDSMHSSHQDNLQQSSNISIRSHDYE